MTIRRRKIADILKMPSSEGFRDTVADVLEWKTITPGMVEDMARDGNSAVPPVHIATRKNLEDCGDYWDTGGDYADFPEIRASKLMLGNGHHRVKVACMLGWKYIDTTDDVTESGEE